MAKLIKALEHLPFKSRLEHLGLLSLEGKGQKGRILWRYPKLYVDDFADEFVC